MKIFLSMMALFLSAPAFSSSYIEHAPNSTTGVAAPGGQYIGSSFNCVNESCYLKLFDPSFFLTADMYEMYYGDIENLYDSLFMEDGNIYFREMWISQAFKSTIPSSIRFEWTATGVETPIFNINGERFSSLTGIYQNSFGASSPFQIYMFAEAFSSDAYLELKMTSIPQVPLPASLFLFAPVLLGLIGLRRRLS